MGFFRRDKPVALERPPSPAGPEYGPPFWRVRWKLRLLVFTPLCLSTLAVAAAGLLFLHYTIAFPDPLSLWQRERTPIIRILAADGSVLAERGGAHDYMPLDLLPAHVIDAVVATEDRRFYEHNGLDYFGLIRAMFANIRAGRYAQGGSTLTQQLAKNLFLSPQRTIGRKAEELALALWLEVRLSKPDILELYLNRVYFGAGAYGIEAAAQRYFDKSARSLTLGESAVIAALLKAPSKFSPLTNPGAARTRARAVLKKMLAAGYITAEAEAEASRRSVRFAAPRLSKETSGVEYAIDFVLERMPPLIRQFHAKIIVETTIDARLQRTSQTAVEKLIEREGSQAQVSQAAVAVVDMEGGILAMVGGRSHAESQYNRAIKSRRQPGSAFKPFVYLAALESGLTPESTVYDLPVNIGGWTPRNDNNQFKGAITLRQGLSQSINTVAVRLQYDVGVRKVMATARRLGIKSELRASPSLALGASEVSLMEITGAYASFANGGRRVEPHVIRRIRNGTGQILHAMPAVVQQPVISPAHAGAMNDMLNATLVSGTGRRAALFAHPAGGKTGTTQEFRDAWFIGYTAHLSAGVWVGNDQGQPMNNVRGGSLPAQIWHEIMTRAHQDRSPVALPGTARFPERPGDVPFAPSYNAPTPEAPATVLAPREPIDADFFARILNSPFSEPVGNATPRAQPEPDKRLLLFGLEGLMALGGKR